MGCGVCPDVVVMIGGVVEGGDDRLGGKKVKTKKMFDHMCSIVTHHIGGGVFASQYGVGGW